MLISHNFLFFFFVGSAARRRLRHVSRLDFEPPRPSALPPRLAQLKGEAPAQIRRDLDNRSNLHRRFLSFPPERQIRGLNRATIFPPIQSSVALVKNSLCVSGNIYEFAA